MSVHPTGQTVPTPVPSPLQNGHAVVTSPPATTTPTTRADTLLAGAAPPQAVKAEPGTLSDTSNPPSPPARIVSDLPGVASYALSSAMPPATTPAVTLPSINSLAFRTSGSPAPNLPSPLPPTSSTPTMPSQAPAPVVIKWKSRPEPTHTLDSPHPAKSPRMSIMDAPGTGSPSPVPRSNKGFLSPGRDHIHSLPKFNDDRTRITFGIQQSLPEAVRRCVRDNWEKCLIGSDFHQAFVLNATIHHATPASIKRSIRDFGKSMVAAAKEELIDQMTTAQLDQLADRILAKASEEFLDKALETRLKTIEAKRLINALARAERLGYEPSDVQEDSDLPSEQPAISSTTDYTSTPHRQSPPSTLPATSSHRFTRVPAQEYSPFCTICLRRFSKDSAHQYHTKYKVCTRIPSSPYGFPYNCKDCGQGFTTTAGLNYHDKNNVCGDPSSQNSAVSQLSSTSPAVPNPQVSTPMAAKHAYSTPRPSSTTQAPKAPRSLGTPSAADPYAHLSNEQMLALQAELDDAEAHYAQRMREANITPDPAERKAKLDSLSNSFGTKQSIIRKKYGVRLRLRRSKAEILNERERMRYTTSSELQAMMGISNPGTKPGRKPTKLNGSRPGSSGGLATPGQMSTSKPTTTLASSLPVPQNTVEGSNDVGMHGGSKRSYSGDGESPSYKRIAYTDMGGLGGAMAAAETMDPTMPKASAAAAAAAAATAVSTILRDQERRNTADAPVTLDDSDTASGEGASGDDDDKEEEDDDDDDDGDIPAQLPASVLQSLQRSSSTATASPRPGSS